MTSIQASIKQNDGANGYFISLQGLAGKIYDYLPAGASVAGAPGSFSTAVWATPLPVSGTYNGYLSTVNAAGALYKDMGKTVVSASRTFRKVQLVVQQSSPGISTATSTFGVAGQAGTTHDYLTGYIELGMEGGGAPAPVARFGR